MEAMHSPLRWGRWRSYLVLLVFFVSLSALLRAALWLKTGAQAPWGVGQAFQVFGVGLVYDLVAGASLLLPLMVFLFLMPARWLEPVSYTHLTLPTKRIV